MFRKLLRNLFRLMVYLLIAGVVIIGLPRLIMVLATSSRTYEIDKAPKVRLAVVFGAGLQRDGTPSPVLRDRVETAAELYFSGKVEKILMSGDNRTIYYNEPGSMEEYAISLGVPKDAIVLDYAGWRTYDTCYRAKEIFGAQDVLLVTQSFHLPRALFTCQQLGLTAWGVRADRREYRKTSALSWEVRELPATLVAIWDVWVTHPLPVLGDKEPIFPDDEIIN